MSSILLKIDIVHILIYIFQILKPLMCKDYCVCRGNSKLFKCWFFDGQSSKFK